MDVGFKTIQAKRYIASMKNPVCKLSIIYMVAISAIIRADYKYIDDLGRVAHGYQGWGDFSRHLSDFLSRFIHADNYLTDISPLAQLIAVFLLSLASVIVIYVLSDEQKITLWQMIAVLPLGLSPYFLECISYKYDSPYMALSILASVFPLLMYEYGTWVYFGSVIIGVLMMCNTYQAASGIYPILVAMLCCKWWNTGKSFRDIVRFFVMSAAGYVVAFGIYEFFIMKPIDSYVSTNLVSIDQFARQLFQYFLFVYCDFKKWWLVLTCLLPILFIYFTVRDSVKAKYQSLVVAIFTVCTCAVMCFGMYPVLNKPLYAPRAMYGFGALLAFFGVVIIGADKNHFAKIVCFGLSYSFFAFAFTYGNALAEQSRYTEFRVEAVIDDLNDLDAFNKSGMKIVQLSGNIGKSPIINNMPQEYQILNRLIPNTFGDGEWMWQQYYFYNYFALKNVDEGAGVNLAAYDLPILKDTMYHTIRGNDEYILVELK